MYDKIKNTKRHKLHIENLLNVKKTVRNTCATAFRKETCETALTALHTPTLRQPADNWQMNCEVGNSFSLHILCLSIYLLFLPIYIFALSAYIFALPAYIYPLICTNLVLK